MENCDLIKRTGVSW